MLDFIKFFADEKKLCNCNIKKEAEKKNSGRMRQKKMTKINAWNETREII